ncbi:MAG TPA: SurA N-terminal domain-containing protein [Pyrinomonadaceae bacterium]|nr:SurA N-terminal domain-containing protein [Pyrinomonadaceae bacterium]
MHRVRKQFAAVSLALALAAALAACDPSKPPGGGTGGGADVAATVNGKSILLSEVDRIVSQQTRGGAGGAAVKLSPLEQAAARLQVLDQLIQRQVLFDRAEKEKTVPSEDEVNTYINNQRSRMTQEEWERSLRENNLTEAQVRDEARKDLAIRKLQEKLFGRINIRDQEIVDFFNNNKEQFVNPRGVFLSDIVADPVDYAGQFRDDAKSDAEAAAKIQRLHAQLKSGADFATVARASSEDPSSVRGGDIGFATEEDLKQNGFPPDLIARLFGPMNVGDITEPIRFPNGRWYIFKLTDRQLETKPLTLDDPRVRERIKQGLINQRQTILNEALIRNAMGDATVVNNLAGGMLNDPSTLGGLQQVSPGGAAATPAASADASPSPGPTAAPGGK